MFTSRMIRLFAVVLDKDAEKVTADLLRRGVMHFINITRVKGGWGDALAEVGPQVNLAKIVEMRKRIDGFLGQIDRRPKDIGEIDLTGRGALDLDGESRKLDQIAGGQQEIRERQRVIQQEILKLEDIRRQVEMFGAGLQGIRPSTQYSFLSVRFGRIRMERRGELDGDMADFPSVALKVGEENGDLHLLVISMKRDSDRIETILKKVGWVQVDLPSVTTGMKEDVSKDLDAKLDVLNREQEGLRGKARAILEQHSGELEALWARLRVNELFYRVQSFFKRTARAVVFTGWLPSSKKSLINEDIRRATAGRCYLEWHEPQDSLEWTDEKEKVPVQFRNPGFLAPFQMLVSNFGIPEYGTVDPTPFVMVIYLIMFGLMFADVGQGALVVIAGVIGAIFTSRKKAGALQNLMKLMIWCGSASMATGVLFGSYFGFAALKPLWFDFHGIVRGHPHGHAFVNSIFGVLGITIYFGIAVIWMGLLFNWINLVKKRRWEELALDKGGILGGWIYGGGIYTAWYMVRHGYKGFPDFSVLMLLVGVPALLLFLRGPVHFFHERKVSGKRFGIFTLFNFGMDWGVELLEIFSRYLSNTLSFMRVAGLGIAHVSLMSAFFEIAHMVGGGSHQGAAEGAYTIPGLIVLVFGNIMVLGLEGLSAGIQSLRLNYYEFFTKFFHGTGELYSPISLISRDD